MRIAYTSDLHLDHHADRGYDFLESLEVPKCDLLVVAGDLSQVDMLAFDRLHRICDLAPKVLWVLGNHEYYNGALREVEDYLQRTAAFHPPNITIASKARVINIDGLKILAGTMWFPDAPDHRFYKKFMNDFGWINNLEPEVYKRNRDFDIALHGIKDEECIVVTHHLPCAKSIHPRFAHSGLNRFFVGGEYYHTIKDSKIKAWIHGHSHEPVHYQVGNTKVLSSPLGYPSEIKHNWSIRVVDV